MSLFTRSIIAIIGATLALSGCSANPPTAPTVESEDTVLVRKQLAETSDKTAEAVRYYASKQRHDNMRGFLRYAGRELMDKMLSGEIPYNTTHWNDSDPAPRNGWGQMESMPSTGNLLVNGYSIQLSVRLTNGAVDTAIDPTSLYITTPDYELGFIGDSTYDSENKPRDTPDAFSWSWKAKKGDPQKHGMSLQDAFIEFYYGPANEKPAPLPIEERCVVATPGLQWNSLESIRENMQRFDNSFLNLLLEVVPTIDGSGWK